MASKLRDRIVATAVKRFAAHGYHGVSTRDIAKRADVTEGSLFRVCVSKDALFAEALAHALAVTGIRPTVLRLAAYALLEGKGLTAANRKGLAALGARSRFIKELSSVLK